MSSALAAGADLSVRPSLARTFGAMLMRDLRVLRREAVAFILRTVGQPFLFVFVFTFVLPTIGSGQAGMFGIGGGGPSGFATILVPGLVAMSLVFSAMMAVTMPLVMELSYTKEIEDRLLAPAPVWMLGVEKIVAGALQGLVASAVVFPIVLFVHAPGISPRISVNGWAVFVVVLLFGALLAGALGLLIGTLVEPRRINMIFPLVMIPGMMLGCVFYPWAALGSIRWLQILALINPIVYATEGLRTVLTPSLPHMPAWAFLLVLVGGTALLGALAVWQFRRKVLSLCSRLLSGWRTVAVAPVWNTVRRLNAVILASRPVRCCGIGSLRGGAPPTRSTRGSAGPVTVVCVSWHATVRRVDCLVASRCGGGSARFGGASTWEGPRSTRANTGGAVREDGTDRKYRRPHQRRAPY